MGTHAFLRWFADQYHVERGVPYYIHWGKDSRLVAQLLRTIPPTRLQELALILLTSNDPFIAKTDRGIGIFSRMITWLQARLAAWEVQHGQAQVSLPEPRDGQDRLFR